MELRDRIKHVERLLNEIRCCDIGNGDYASVTYEQLVSLIHTSTLVPGRFYLINDFQTVYDQPDYDYQGNAKSVVVTKTGAIERIIVLATSINTLSIDAWSLDFPQDTLKYTPYFGSTELTGTPCKGRIIERVTEVDVLDNRADYDHRKVLFLRYDSYDNLTESPLTGTMDLSALNVVGTGTLFTTELNPGDYIRFDSIAGYYFTVDTIIDDEHLTVVKNDNALIATGDTGSLFTTTLGEFINYKDNGLASSEVSTFGPDSYNNYIGDNIQALSGNMFLLSNNVFLINATNNYLKTIAQNNTFQANASDNIFDSSFTVGNSFGTSFVGNKIHEYMSGNIISSDFANNIINSVFVSCTVGIAVGYNIFNRTMSSCFLRSNFQKNTVDTRCNAITFGALSTGDFNKHMVEGSVSGTQYIVYTDDTVPATPVLIYDSITA